MAAMKKVAAQQLCPRLAYLNDCDGSAGEPRSLWIVRREALFFLVLEFCMLRVECPKSASYSNITGTGYKIDVSSSNSTIQIPELEVDTNHWTHGKHKT